MQEQIEASQYVLVICTQTYRRRAEGKEDSGKGLGSQWEAKLIRQLIYNTAGINSKFVPVLLTIGDRSNIPLALQDYSYFCVDTEKGYQNLLRVLTNQPLISKPPLRLIRQLPGRDRQPDYNNHVWNVPWARNRFFTGREKLLDELRSTFIDDHAPRMQAICGLGGVGKSHLALEFGYRERARFTGVLWLNGSSSLSFARGVGEVARLLNLPEADAEDQRVPLTAVRRWLAENSDWLLVVDDVTEPTLVQAITPAFINGSVLLTSRASNFRAIGIANPIVLDVLSNDDAVTFFFAASGRSLADPSEVAAARELVSELGCLPLALEQAAAYITDMQARFADYLTSFKSLRLVTLAKTHARAGRSSNSVHTTWNLNLEAAKRESTASADVLYVSAFLSSDRIPLDFFVRGAADLGPNISASLAAGTRDDPLAVDLLIAPLLRYSLVQKQFESGSFSIHPVLQEVIREQLSDSAHRGWVQQAIGVVSGSAADSMDRIWVARIIRALSTTFPSSDYINWPVCGRLAPHVIHVAELMQSMGLVFPAAGAVLLKTGQFLRKRSQFEASTRLLQLALTNAKRASPGDVPAILDTLGVVYTAQGKYADAETILRKAIALRKNMARQTGEAAKTLNNLALLLMNMGRKEEAENLLGQVIDARSFDESSFEGATVLQNLADLKREAGSYAESESLYHRAISMKRRLLQPDHPDLAQALNNLAVLYRVQGRLADAQPLQEEAMEILEKVLGSEHRDVAASLTNLGVLYCSQGKYQQAEHALLRAYSIFERVHAQDHPDFAEAIGCLGIVYMDQERFAEAEPLLTRALKIQEETVGTGHPALSRLLNSLAALFWRLGRYPETESYIKRALAIGEKTLGPLHPELATVLANYALLLRATGRISEAIDVEARVRHIRNLTR
jgi:tetratricopeptide (TPR) repeat protein